MYSHNCFYYTSKPECAIPDDNVYMYIFICIYVCMDILFFSPWVETGGDPNVCVCIYIYIYIYITDIYPQMCIYTPLCM
jgi:hypothetical protein